MPSTVASVTGPSKSGKTVLCREIMKDSEFVWIEGGQINDVDKLWSKLASALQQPSSIEETDATATGVESEATVSGGLRIPFIGQGGGSVSGKGSRVKTVMTTRNTSIDIQDACLRHMIDNDIALVIDDFHYIDRPNQVLLIRNLRGAMFNGLKLILISVPHHAYAAQIAEHELTGRLVHVEVPDWCTDDLEQIAELGAAALNFKLPKKLSKQFAQEAMGSPNIMQQICWDLCFNEGIEATLTETKQISARLDTTKIYLKLADDAGLPVYTKLSRGPQSRSARIGRKLRKGKGEVDIYEAILLAVAATGPEKILTYDEIRESLSNILADKPPQKIEVSNALSHLSKIAEDIAPSNRPIEWMGDELQLVLADPRFRFFMRWKLRNLVA